MDSGKDICFSILKYVLTIFSILSSIGIVLILFEMSYLVSADEIESIEDKYGLAIFCFFHSKFDILYTLNHWFC